MQSVLEEWREAARPFFDIKPLDHASGFDGQAVFRRAGSLVLSQVRFSSQRMEHDPRHLRAFDHDFLLLERYRSGVGRGLADGAATRVDAQIMHMIDMSRHYVTMTTDVVAEGVLMPHAAVGYDPSIHSPRLSIPVGSERERILGPALDALFDAAGRNDQGDAADLGATFTALVRSFFTGEAGEPDEPDEAAERGRALLLRDYILRNLHDMTLDAERMCRDLGMSRATLYRMLGAEGGARNYVIGLRLEKCFAELVASPAERGQVRSVAERWGFFDPASFHHSFRRRFGFSPSDCLGQPCSAEASPEDPYDRPAASILDWLQSR